MSDIAIRVEGIGKQFRIGAPERYRTLRDTLTNALSAPLRRLRNGRSEPSESQIFWALKDVSFEVKHGEVIGIIGRNGAGKSTLLKILSRITEPTLGHAEIHGRVASLLEVGTGFHPELTGRENIFLNGAILGMKKAEIIRKFDEIVAFAEVEKFIDTPVKHYSSGMYVRLAFAVAAHLDPEILIVDEVLAVGDAEFQKKCLGRMEHIAGTQGRTVFFVSHNMPAIQSLCGRVMRFRDGRRVGDGAALEQITAHLAAGKKVDALENGSPVALGPALKLHRLTLTPAAVPSGSSLQFAISINATAETSLTDLALLIYSGSGVRVGILDFRNGLPRRLSSGQNYDLDVTVRALHLVEGDYQLGLYVECANYWGNHYDVATLTVLSKARLGDVTPPPAHYRGLVDFEYTFSVNGDRSAPSHFADQDADTLLLYDHAPASRQG